MLPAYCTDVEEYREWIKGPPPIRDYRDQPHYEGKMVAAIDIEVAEWLPEPDLQGHVEIAVPALLEPSLKERFLVQSKKLRKETQHLSSPGQIMMHPSYQAILGMGAENTREIIGMMIEDMQQHRTAWFWALSYLAQDNPVSQSDAGKTDKMVKAWVDWGKARRIL